MNRRITWRFAAVIVSGMSALKVSAGGFELPDQDAFATARGEAFVATANNASAIYYNPAGLAQLDGHNLRAGFYGISLDPEYTPPAPGDTNTFNSKNGLAAVPQFFYAYAPAELPLAFGIGVYCPFGLSVKWPQDTGFRTIGTEGALKYFRINPVMAVELAPNFSIGGGVTINYADVKLAQGLYPVETGGDGFEFQGDGWTVGYNLGALWQPHEKISLGVSFRSATTINMQGHTTLTLPPFVPTTTQEAEAEFKFPWGAICGISYRPTPKWNLEFNADYTDWSSIGTLVIKQAAPQFPLPQDIPVILNWRQSWLFEFGVTRYFDCWHVSAGYVLNENAVPTAHYTPLVEDQDRHFFSLGGGFKGNHLEFDVAYQLGYGPTRTVSGSAPSPVGQTADGKYEFVSHAVLLTVGCHF